MDITVTLQCNNNCVFCPRDGYLEMIVCKSLRLVYRSIEETRLASNKIVLSGGEVTALKNILPIVKFCKKQNFEQIGIITNGRNLSDLGFTKILLSSGVNDFAVSLYSTNSEVHDGITRVKGSCYQTRAGLLNLLKLSSNYRVSVRVNIVLNFWNKEDIYVTLDELYRMGVKSFILAEQIILDRKSKYLCPDQIKEFLKEVKQLHLEGAHLSLRGFAACLLPGKYKSSVLKKSNPRIIFEMHEMDTFIKGAGKKDKYLKKVRDNFVYIDKCSGCGFKNQCPGLQKAYVL